ncbi:alpha-N-acetylgalactosamine-specific lectin-like [Patiria miniata]|uniref:C-type lectin domain-containing protein n=1 Tax=Patiria miniata TaxID=46514 RepID=A0A914AFE8_PATMI|nr:alpha-N-acetylgalactosamine-specific lectin-like [Patiria miniata]
MRKFWQVLMVLFAILNRKSLADGPCRRIARYTVYDCEPAWQAFKDNCYLRVAEGKNYTNAEQHCQSYSKQWRPTYLASILSDDENQFIATLIDSSDTWIGYNDLAVEGVYTWLDGSPVSYTNWKPGFPVGDAYGNQDCIHMFEGPQWKEFYCDGKMNFVRCQDIPLSKRTDSR